MDLMELIGNLVGVISKNFLDRIRFTCIVQRRGCAMGIDVIHFVGVDVGISQCPAHRANGASTFGIRRCNAVSIARRSMTHHLGIDSRLAIQGMVKLFEDQANRCLLKRQIPPGR